MAAFKKSKSHSSLAPDLISNPEVLEVNLVRDEVAVEFNWPRRLGSLFLVLVLVIALVLEIYFGLNWWQGQERSQAEKLKAEHLTVTQQINNINNNAKDFIGFKDKISLVEQLIDQHIYWSDFFTWLEQNTLSSVHYLDFSGDINGEYTLAAQTKNYRDVAWQAKAFRDNPWVDEVSVSAANLQEIERERPDDEERNTKEEWVVFNVDLKIKPEIFYRFLSQVEGVAGYDSDSEEEVAIYAPLSPEEPSSSATSFWPDLEGESLEPTESESPDRPESNSLTPTDHNETNFIPESEAPSVNEGSQDLVGSEDLVNSESEETNFDLETEIIFE